MKRNVVLPPIGVYSDQCLTISPQNSIWLCNIQGVQQLLHRSRLLFTQCLHFSIGYVLPHFRATKIFFLQTVENTKFVVIGNIQSNCPNNQVGCRGGNPPQLTNLVIFQSIYLAYSVRSIASVLLSFLGRGGDQAQLARLEVGDVKRHSGLIGMGMDDILAAGAV